MISAIGGTLGFIYKNHSTDLVKLQNMQDEKNDENKLEISIHPMLSLVIFFQSSMPENYIVFILFKFKMLVKKANDIFIDNGFKLPIGQAPLIYSYILGKIL